MLAEKWELNEESHRSGQLSAQKRHPGYDRYKRTQAELKT